MPEPAAVDIKNISKWYGTAQVLRDVSLNVAAGEAIAVIGPSGSGKSTLLRCINGLEEIQRGELVVDGFDIRAKRRKLSTIRQEIGFVFQNFNLYPHMTAFENIELAPQHVRKISKQAARQVSTELLESVGLAGMGDKYPNSLSGGQQQRVAIARCLAMKPKLMLFDEPTSALDPEMIKEVLKVIGDVVRSGMTMILVTHELKFAEEVADRVVFMDSGEIIEINTPHEVFTNPREKRTQRFLSQVL